MPKIDIVSEEQAEEIVKQYKSSIPRGSWMNLCLRVKNTRQCIVVSDITRGQAWALRRTAKQVGVTAIVLENGRRVVLKP
jgi:hypothetical protein